MGMLLNSFNKFMHLGSHYYNPVSEHFFHSRTFPHAHLRTVPIFDQATTDLLSTAKVLPFEISCICIHTVCCLLFLNFFNWHDDFESHPCCAVVFLFSLLSSSPLYGYTNSPIN